MTLSPHSLGLEEYIMSCSDHQPLSSHLERERERVSEVTPRTAEAEADL